MSKNGMFQFRSAVYTSERFPRSLLSLFSFCWMCQLSRMHRVVVYGLLSSTSALLRFTPWPAVSACSASAEAATSPFLRARQCSFSWCFRDLPVCPMYTFGHSVQGIEQTTPFHSSIGTRSLGWRKNQMAGWLSWMSNSVGARQKLLPVKYS